MGVLLFLLSTTRVNFPAHLHTHALLPISSHQGNGIAPVSFSDYFLLPSSDPFPKCALHYTENDIVECLACTQRYH